MRRLALGPAYADEQGAKDGDIDNIFWEEFSRRKQKRAEDDKADKHDQDQPALPRDRQTPSPTIALGGKPISRIVRHAHDQQSRSRI